MSVKFTHYLITRFNVPVKNWDQDKNGLPTLDASWMKDRLNLFHTYCLPTIQHQQNIHFHWLVYCDRKTLKESLNEIQRGVETVAHGEIRLADDFDDLMSDLKKLLSEVSTPHVITSRVDNDDGLGKNYIRLIQEHFAPHDQLLLNLNGGILYDRQLQIITELRPSRLNHYGSLIEQTNAVGDYLTVMGFPHHQPPDNMKITDIDCKYAWLKIIHARNLSSRISGIPLQRKTILAHYSIDKNSLPVSGLNTVKYFIGRIIPVVKRKFSFR